MLLKLFEGIENWVKLSKILYGSYKNGTQTWKMLSTRKKTVDRPHLWRAKQKSELSFNQKESKSILQLWHIMTKWSLF